MNIQEAINNLNKIYAPDDWASVIMLMSDATARIQYDTNLATKTTTFYVRSDVTELTSPDRMIIALAISNAYFAPRPNEQIADKNMSEYTQAREDFDIFLLGKFNALLAARDSGLYVTEINKKLYFERRASQAEALYLKGEPYGQH